MKKFVYSFNEGNREMKDLLGGKGANLAEMTSIGLPVPQGFTITTEACNEFYKRDKKIWDELEKEIFEFLVKLEDQTGKKFGSDKNPLLVSVRSGAKISMPGMMDTILNLGLNDKVVNTIADVTNNPRFAYDSYRRFIQMFSDVVMEIPKYLFELVLDDIKEQKGYKFDTDLDVEDLKEVVKRYKKIYLDNIKEDFPQDPKEQLIKAVFAVFKSWNNKRAIIYREQNDISHEIGTAVNVQSMVFGNMGDDCGTGVAFTRNPSTGEKEMIGEFLMNAQGEDVVAGIRTPMTIDKLKEENVEAYNQFLDICSTLENHYRDMQDIEFTIENRKLYLLQTRNGKRTAKAAIRIAIDLYEEGLITKDEALMKVEPKQLDQLLHPTFDKEELKNAVVLGRGLAASPGAATGRVCFTAEMAVKKAAEYKDVILVRNETSPEDIEGMTISNGILTSKGGITSHAAVVARGMGKCCVCGCEEIYINEAEKYFKVNGKVYKEGDYISIDGSTGNVYEGVVKTSPEALSDDFYKLMSWADDRRRLMVRTNADTPEDAQNAVKFGAEGIGLCRTEHMFFEESRILAIREMIVSDTKEEREHALSKILPYQKQDFIDIFKVMAQRPVTIRLLDPPLHEFLPSKKEDIEELSKTINVDYNMLMSRIKSLHEFNPMLGHRGCRLAVTYPEIAVMQTTAIIEAALYVKKEEGIDVVPEIMIPLIGDINELRYIENVVKKTADTIIEKSNVELNYKFGTMIEVPRGALTSDEVAESAEFFSFGTNDLTQMTYGFSRDDANKFIQEYKEKKIFEKDPFVSIDEKGVGKLIKIAYELGRKTRPDLKIGICGEHGGDPKSIEFCNKVGLDYVSCSPFRVPIARLAAAQAVIKG